MNFDIECWMSVDQVLLYQMLQAFRDYEKQIALFNVYMGLIYFQFFLSF